MKISLGPKAYALPSPVWVIGSYSAHEQPNIMVASWCSVCCTNPPCLGVSIRNNRATIDGIIEHSAFTVNIPSRDYLAEVDYVGTVSGVSCDKFSKTGLTAVRSKLVDAPYVREFSLILECSLLHRLEIGSHTQFIGQVFDVKANPEVLDDQTIPLAARIDPLISCAGDRAYFALGNYLAQTRVPGSYLMDTQCERMSKDRSSDCFLSPVKPAEDMDL